MNKKLVTTLVAVLIFSFSVFNYTQTSPSTQVASPQASVSEVTTTENNTATTKLYSVVRVVDGDTIVISYNNTNTKVRLLGINTPETVDPRKTVECFGKEASLYTKQLLQDRQVSIVFDQTQGEKDKYGRLLAYVYRDDDLFVNKDLVVNGYAYEYTYHTPYLFQKEFKDAQTTARQEQRGLWNQNMCSH